MHRIPFRPILGATVQAYPAGWSALVEKEPPQPGDFILCHEHAWTSYLIRFGQWLRFHGERAKYAHWSHSALIVSASGDLIEANSSGIERGHLDRYEGVEYHVVRLGEAIASDADRAQAVAFATACLGQPYGFVTFASIALSLLTGLKFSFGFEGQQVCSGLVARALERTTCIFNRDPAHMTPGDLAEVFDLTPSL